MKSEILQYLPWVIRTVGMAAGLTCAPFAPASAQVLELEPDGSVQTISRPMIVTPQGRRAILPKAQPAPPSVGTTIAQAARRHDLSPALVEAVAWQESRLRQDAVSPKGAQGVMQLMPATARALGVDARDAAANIDGGAAYLAALMRRYDGDVMLSLAAYNAGPGAVERHGGVPPYTETQGYVAGILDHLAAKTEALP